MVYLDKWSPLPMKVAHDKCFLDKKAAAVHLECFRKLLQRFLDSLMS